MKVNFFETTCREASRSDSEFGLCDDQNQTKAYSDIETPAKWTATIKNNESIEICFTPLDKCLLIFKPGTSDEESLCDGMLTFDNSIFLVELKNKGTGGWISEAIVQLKNTIRLLTNNHPDFNKQYKYKKAYGCNRKHPYFSVLESAQKRRFMNETGGFRLDINATIIV